MKLREYQSTNIVMLANLISLTSKHITNKQHVNIQTGDKMELIHFADIRTHRDHLRFSDVKGLISHLTAQDISCYYTTKEWDTIGCRYWHKLYRPVCQSDRTPIYYAKNSLQFACTAYEFGIVEKIGKPRRIFT